MPCAPGKKGTIKTYNFVATIRPAPQYIIKPETLAFICFLWFHHVPLIFTLGDRIKTSPSQCLSSQWACACTDVSLLSLLPQQGTVQTLEGSSCWQPVRSLGAQLVIQPHREPSCRLALMLHTDSEHGVRAIRVSWTLPEFSCPRTQKGCHSPLGTHFSQTVSLLGWFRWMIKNY